MRASAFSPRLDVRERIPSGPTGALSVLFEAEGASVSGAHVAYPSGDAVVVAETHVGFPSTFSRVALAEGEDEGSSPREPPSCVAWAPGETRGALLVARGCEIHLCAPAERDDDDETSAPSRSSPYAPRRCAWESVGRARCAAKVVAAAWTSDGTAFVSAAADGELRAWRVEETDAPDEEAETRDRASYGRSFLGVRTAWRVVAETSGKPHTTLAAGASVSAPVASAARGSRFARVWDARGYLAQTLRHPTAVTSARWKLETPETPDAFRSRGTASISFTNTVALVTTSEDGAARVWTACGPAASERGATDAPVRLAQTVVVQTDPGPSGYGPALVAAHWLAWRPEPRSARRERGSAARAEGDKEPSSPETPGEGRSRTRVSESEAFGFGAAAVPARDGADFLAALGSDGAVWVWMLEGFDATAGERASARVPRAHLWRRAPVEEDVLSGRAESSRARLAHSASPAYFSATWARPRMNRADGTHDGDSADSGLGTPRGDPPPLRVVIASPEAGARACEVDLAARDAGVSSRVTLARAAAFRGHAHGDAVTLVRACDETGAVVSVDARGNTRVWKWRRDETGKGGAKPELAPVSFRAIAPRGVSAAAWYRGALFLATAAGVLETHAFCGDDAWVLTKVSAVSTRGEALREALRGGGACSGTTNGTGGRDVDASTVASLDVVADVAVADELKKIKNPSAPATILAATRRNGEVLSWALVANDGFHVPAQIANEAISCRRLGDGDAFSRVASRHPGSVPAVPAGPPAHARAFAAARVDADGDIALAACEAATEEVECVRSGFALRWTDAGCLGRDAREKNGETPTALAASPSGAAVALALPDGRVEVWEAEGDARGAFALAAEFPGAGASSCHLSWFDLGGGAEALAVARGARVEVRVARREAWRVLAAADLSRLPGGASGVGGLAWSARGDALVAGVGHELVALAPAEVGGSLARVVAEAAAALPEYHPRVMMDWLVRGETRRARAAARRVCARLREATAHPSTDPGWLNVPASVCGATVAQLLEESAVCLEPDGSGNATSLTAAAARDGRAPPEFDAGAFGGFAGFGGASRASGAPARFAFGVDTHRANELEHASSDRDASARFTAAEAEEAASLVARRGAEAALPGLTGADRVGVLATLDALRDADGGADAGDDEAGRRFRALRRARALRDARVATYTRGSAAPLDTCGPRGEELAWALHSDAQDALLTSFGFSRTAEGSEVTLRRGLESAPTGDASWRALRLAGAPLWVRDDETLRKLVDAAARQAFAASRDPGGENPCALLFAALGRAATLAGLFRASRDARLADFFARDFSERKNKEAALKNAYALLSKHRYLFASAFFVLAGQPQDAAGLVWKHAGDLSLAVAVARLAKDAKDGDDVFENARDDISSGADGDGRASRDETRLGGEASDDGTLSASAFAVFGDFAAAPPSSAGSAQTTRFSDAPEIFSGAKPKEEAPLPASLSPAAKAFVKARVVPDFEARLAESHGKSVEDAWTLAALRWLCGDGAASVETLRRLVRDASVSSEDAASAADLCAYISRRRALLEAAPALARDAADAADDAAGRLALALEAGGMPLAALERFGKEGRDGVTDRSAEHSADRAEGPPRGALAASAATRAREGVVARLAAAALAPETSPGSSPEASLKALARAAPAAFAGGAAAAARASLARRDASLAFSVAAAAAPRSGASSPNVSDAARRLERTNVEDVEDAEDPAAFESETRSRSSVDLDPEAAAVPKTASDAPATPRAAKKASGFKRLRDRLSVKIRGPLASPSHSGEPGEASGFVSPPDTPASPPSPAPATPPPSGFDVLMPGFGVAVLADTPARAAPPAVFEKSPPASSPVPGRPERTDASATSARGVSGVSGASFAHEHRRAGIPSKGRCLRGPVEIACSRGDAFYGACVNPAAPHQIGLACVKKGLVIADLRALAAAGAPRAPDGRAVVGAAAVLRAAAAAPTLARLWADPKNGRCAAGGLDGTAPWPRSAWRRPRRAAPREMTGVGSRAAAAAAADTTRIDWSAATGAFAAAAAGVAANAAAAMGAADAPEIGAAFAGGGVPGDAAARCVEAHPREPVLLAGDAFGSVSVWRFAADADGADGAFAGAVRLPTARVEARRGDVHLAGRADAAAASARARVHMASPGSAAAGSASGERGHPRVTAGSSRFDDSFGSGTTNANTGLGGLGTTTNGVSVSSVAWGPNGARFAAGGSDGATAVWRSDQFLDASASPASFRAPPSPGKSRVEAIAFASAAVVAAVGSHLDSRDGRSAASLVLWDTLRPSRAPPAAAAAAHEGGATALCWLPGFAGGASPWPLLATAGRDGDIAAHDLRKLSCAAGAQTSVLWRARRVDAGVGHAAAVKALAVVNNPRGSVGCSSNGYLVSGCKDGDVRVWSCASGAHAQHFAAAHERHTFLAPRGGGRNVLQVGVSKLVPLARGALSCGGDGTVKLFRLAPEAFEADRGGF